MPVVTKFTPLMGGANDEGPLCYLLEIDQCRILLDCGWDDGFDVEQLKLLENEVKKGIHAILLSHPDLAHIGALPYACVTLGLNAPIYATQPVFEMGQLFFYDILLIKRREEDFTTFTFDDVDETFEKERFVLLKYSQHARIEEFEIDITPYSAGHMIGGTMWKIQKENEEILYAVDYNHKRERHLNSSSLETFERSSLLITDAFNALRPFESRKMKDEYLFKAIRETFKQGGEVLLPVDTAGRALELLLLLDREWRNFEFEGGEVGFLSHMSTSTIDFANRQLEWMTPKLSFDSERERPFSFKYITLCHKLEDLELLRKPRVVLATVPSLECGFSRSLFAQWAQNPHNLVLFTTIERKSCLSTRLLKKQGTQFTETLSMKYRVALEGEELAQFLAQKEQEQDLLKQQQQHEENSLAAINAGNKQNENNENDDDDDEENAILPVATDTHFENSYDYFVEASSTGFHPLSHPMFPLKEETHGWDAYGEQFDWATVHAGDPDATDHLMGLTDMSDSVLDLADDTQAGGDYMEMEDQKPTKPVVDSVTIDVRCAIRFIDFEGRSDGKSIKNILLGIAPRKIVLIHGEEAACNDLSAFCREKLSAICKSVLVPKTGEMVDVTSDVQVMKLTLSDTLLKSIPFSSMPANYRVARISGRILPLQKQVDDEEGNTNTDSMQVEEDVSVTSAPNDKFELHPLPEEELPSYNAVFLGDVRLNDLKNLLISHGYEAQLKQGRLICNGIISLEKVSGSITGKARISFDGPLCDEYYQIRDILYQQYCIV